VILDSQVNKLMDDNDIPNAGRFTLKERSRESLIGLGLPVLGLPVFAAWRRPARRI